MTAQTATTHCSFCLKPAARVAKLIAGPGVYICNECVGLCEQILADAGDTQSPPAEVPHWQAMTDEQILESLPRMATVSSQVDTGLQVLVDRLREHGVAWSRIGGALGVTRQSAWERFSGED